MSDIDRRMMEFFDSVLPKMSDADKERLLCFGEGMAFMAGKQAMARGETPAEVPARV